MKAFTSPFAGPVPDLRALGPSNIIEPAAYARVRLHYLRLMVELKRHRRCRVAPHVVLLFENRETVLFQIHEVLHHEGFSAGRIAEEIAHYGCLIPEPGELRISAMVDGGDREHGLEAIASLRRSGGITLESRTLSCGSTLACEGDDDEEDAVQYLELCPSPSMESLIRSQSAPVQITFECGGVRHTTSIGRGLRAQLAQDLGVPAPSLLHTLCACPSFSSPTPLRASWQL